LPAPKPTAGATPRPWRNARSNRLRAGRTAFSQTDFSAAPIAREKACGAARPDRIDYIGFTAH